MTKNDKNGKPPVGQLIVYIDPDDPFSYVYEHPHLGFRALENQRHWFNKISKDLEKKHLEAAKEWYASQQTQPVPDVMVLIKADIRLKMHLVEQALSAAEKLPANTSEPDGEMALYRVNLAINSLITSIARYTITADIPDVVIS